MLKRLILTLQIICVCLDAGHAQSILAPTGELRAVYIVSNLAQATRDPASGTITGVAADVARELARREGVALTITPLKTAADVLDAVKRGEADIGFVAPNPDRTGIVLYSQPYMLVQQSAIVRNGTDVVSVEQLDAPGRIIGVNIGDTVGVWLRTRLRHAKLRETPDYSLKEPTDWLRDGAIDAFAGNRQRLGAGLKGIHGFHLLPDNIYAVSQTVAVGLGRDAALMRINAALGEMRVSGFLEQAIAQSGVDGIMVAPAPN